MLRLAASLAVAAATLVSAAPASARSRQQSQPVPTSRVTVTGAALHTVPQSFLGLSMNVDEMEDYTQQPALPQFMSLITPNGDGPFVLRVGGTYADSAYWNGEVSQIMPQYLAPTYDRVTLNNAWLQSLAGVVSTTGSKVILNVNAANHDPQMALNLVEAAERDLPAGSLAAVAIGNEPNLYPLGYDGITKSNASWVKNFGPSRYDTLYWMYATLLKRHLPSLTLAGPELSTPTPPSGAAWLNSLLSEDAGQVGVATEHYYAYNACVAQGSSNYPELHKYFRATDIASATAAMAPAIASAHNAGIGYRLTELGSSTCLGLPAVTDTFATSLWGLDQLSSSSLLVSMASTSTCARTSQLRHPRHHRGRPERGAAALRDFRVRQHPRPERPAQPGDRRAAEQREGLGGAVRQRLQPRADQRHHPARACAGLDADDPADDSKGAHGTDAIVDVSHLRRADDLQRRQLAGRRRQSDCHSRHRHVLVHDPA